MFNLLATLEEADGLLTLHDLTAMLKISHRTVQKLVAQPDFPSILIGGQRRIDPSQLHRYFLKKNPTMKAFKS